MEEGNTRGSKFKRVCVFCGSNFGNRQVFSDAAIELGDELVGPINSFFHSYSFSLTKIARVFWSQRFELFDISCHLWYLKGAVRCLMYVTQCTCLDSSCIRMGLCLQARLSLVCAD